MKYNINEILKATEPFQKEKDAVKKLEKQLREKEAKKNGASPEEITIISQQTLDICLKDMVAPSCVHLVQEVIMKEFESLGFQAMNEN